jgi:uncharacterized protein DUF6058
MLRGMQVTRDADIAYVRGSFASLDALIGDMRDAVGRTLPRPTYVLPDGSAYVPRDYLRLRDDAGGLAGVPALFARRLAAACDALGFAMEAEVEWQSYLDGLYGACMRDVIPETIVMKECLVARIERGWLADPHPHDAAWRARLRGDVEALDGLTRPFAACDRLRFGPTSRDRLIVATRARFPEAFA